MGAAGSKDLPEDQLHLLTGSEKLRLPDRFDLRTLKQEDRQRLTAASGAQVEYVQTNSLLEAPEMNTAWQEVLLRGERQGDLVQPGQFEWLDPQVLPAVLLESQGRPSEKVWKELTRETDKTGLWKQLQVAREDLHQAVTLLVPVHSSGPIWWPG